MLENGNNIDHKPATQIVVPKPVENNVEKMKEILNSKPVNNTEPADSVHNEKLANTTQTDTPTKNKLNLTIAIPKDEESPTSNVQSATNKPPVEYDVKMEVMLIFKYLLLKYINMFFTVQIIQ